MRRLGVTLQAKAQKLQAKELQAKELQAICFFVYLAEGLFFQADILFLSRNTSSFCSAKDGRC
jgi:hypothetical protein